MSLGFEFLVAARYLRARRREGFVSVVTWFSFLGIVLGVATLIVVMAVMNGFRADLMSRILGMNGHAHVAAATAEEPDFAELAARLARLPGVDSAAPLVEGQALVVGPRPAGVLVRGMAPDDLLRKPVLADRVRGGALADVGDDRAALGWRLAERLGLGIGSRITLVSPEAKAGPFGSMPRTKTFEVAALTDTGMHEFDNALVLVDPRIARALFGPGRETVEVVLDDPEDAAALARVRAAAGEGARVRSWREANSTLASALEVERNVMFVILSLIVAVAAFNIVSSLVMLVKEKTRGIAVLRTVGATRGSVLRIFLLCGTGIGAVGTLAGLALGVSVALNVEPIRQAVMALSGTDPFAPELYLLTRLPSRVEWPEVARVAALALGLSVLATVYPAWKAASVDPVEGLRDE